MKSDIKLYILSVVTGLLVGIVSVIFLVGMQLVTHLIWGADVPGFNQGSLKIVLVLTLAGVLMGLCVKYFGTNDGVGFEAVMAATGRDGELKLYQLPRVVLNAFIGLVSGASIGPETPLITLGGYMGSWLGNILNLPKQQVKAVTTIAFGTSMGVLLESPMAGPVVITESENKLEKSAYYRLIFSIIIATCVGFAILLLTIGPILEEIHMIPEYSEFQPIHMAYGLLIGIVCGGLGLAAKRFMTRNIELAKKWSHRPILRGGLAGLLLGVIAYIAPLTMFSGDHQLPQVVSNAAQYGVVVLLLLAFAKLVSLTVSFAGGYQGGDIFPSFFIAGTLGVAINMIFPAIPLPVAMIAAISGFIFALIRMPLFIVFMLVILSTALLVPVMAAAVAGSALIVLNLDRPLEAKTAE